MHFGSVITKMTSNEYQDVYMLGRFNKLINLYFIQVPVLLIAIYFATLVFFWIRDSLRTEDFMGIKLTTSLGVYILIAFVIGGALFLWYLIPREKPEST